MRRRTKSGLVNVTLFVLALCLIVYLNTAGSSTTKLFAWKRVRYQSLTNTLPPSRGVCPGLSSQTTKPVLVIARIAKEPLSVFDSLSSKYHLCPYTADAVEDTKSVHLQTPANRGHEAMAYLTFLIDNYQSLPDTGLVFVHGSRFAWHNDDPLYDNISLLTQLNVTRALYGPPGPRTGYANMRCDWGAGMCDAKDNDAKPQGSLESRTRAMLEHRNKRIASDVALVPALHAIFGDGSTGRGGGGRGIRGSGSNSKTATTLPTTLGRSDAVRSQCCAQFVVARENIWRHSKEEYVALRQWLLDGSAENRAARKNSTTTTTSSSSHTTRTRPHTNRNRNRNQAQTPISDPSAPADDLIAGRVLSYIWHILFLPSPEQLDEASQAGDNGGVDLGLLNALACPTAEECYCRLYGRCGLKGCTKHPGHCQGQYRLPMGYKLPEDWVERHS